MFLAVPRAGKFPLSTVALALLFWALGGGQAAVAQHCGYGVPPGAYDCTGPVYGPNFGTFGPGYPGFGLEYVTHGYHVTPHPHPLRGSSIHNWGAYVLGKECMYPYVADPYVDPRGAMVPWPPYSAPVAGSTYPVATAPVATARDRANRQ